MAAGKNIILSNDHVKVCDYLYKENKNNPQVLREVIKYLYARIGSSRHNKLLQFSRGSHEATRGPFNRKSRNHYKKKNVHTHTTCDQSHKTAEVVFRE